MFGNAFVLPTNKYFFSWFDSLQWAKVSPLLRFRYLTQTLHTRQDYSGRVIGLTQKPLPDNTEIVKRQTSLCRRNINITCVLKNTVDCIGSNRSESLAPFNEAYIEK